MPGGMPASGREAVKGALACAVAASWPGTRLLSCRSSQRQSWLGTCPFSQAGSSCRHRISRPPPVQVLENELFFQYFSVSAPMEQVQQFDLFSSAVSVDNRTVPSSAHQHTLHPHRHPPAHFPRPHSNHTPVAHPSVWPWQAKIGPSTLSFAMFWVSIVAFSARCASKCAHIFMNVHCASVRSVAVSSPGPGMVGPGEL